MFISLLEPVIGFCLGGITTWEKDPTVTYRLVTVGLCFRLSPSCLVCVCVCVCVFIAAREFILVIGDLYARAILCSVHLWEERKKILIQGKNGRCDCVCWLWRGRPSFLQVTTLHSHNSTHISQHGTTLYGHNSTPHNSTHHNSARPRLDTSQLYTDHMAVRLKLLESSERSEQRYRSYFYFFVGELTGRRFYRIQLYTVIILHTQLNTAHLYIATTRHRTTLNVHNSIQHNSTRHNSTHHNSTRHNSTRHNSTRPQLDTPQPYTATTRHRSHGRTVETTIQSRTVWTKRKRNNSPTKK